MMASSKNADKKLPVLRYTYTPLCDIQVNQVYNVYGIVKYVTNPSRTSTGECYQQISITDPSIASRADVSVTEGRLSCMIFNKEGNLPVPKVGDVVRFHRLKITQYNEKLQGKSNYGFAWLVFDGSGSDYKPVKSSSSNYTLVPTVDFKKIEDLRKWHDSFQLSQTENATKDQQFSSVVVDGFFNIFVQVVAVCQVDVTCLLLRVWDGTKFNGPLQKVGIKPGKTIEQDMLLMEIAKDYLYDILVFDNHVAKASKIRPGDIVQIRNLHAKRVNSDTEEELPSVEFCLHGGGKYFNRDVEVLLNESEQACFLRTNLAKIIQANKEKIGARPESDTSSSLFPLRNMENIQPEANNSAQSLTSALCDLVADFSEMSSMNPQSSQSQTQNEGTSASVCMERNASYILSQHHLPRSDIEEIRFGDVPNKYRLRAKLKKFFPNCESVQDFIHMYCHTCNYLVRLSDREVESQNSCEDGFNGKCPRCSKQSNGFTIGIPKLEMIFVMEILLVDSKGWLVANLWKDEANNFLNVKPEALLRFPENYTILYERLKKLSLNEDEWLECCVRTYYSDDGIRYHMFDTRLTLPD